MFDGFGFIIIFMEKKYTLEELKTKHLVEIVEMDNFSGPSVFGHELFDTKEDAIEFCKKYNCHNNAASVPDCYIVAHYKGKAI